MFPKRNNRNFRAPVSSCQLYDCFNPDISSRPGVTATEDMAVLPGVLGCSFDRLPGTMPGTGRTGSPCDVPFRYASEPIPRDRGTVARWHILLHGLATEIRKISGLIVEYPAMGAVVRSKEKNINL